LFTDLQKERLLLSGIVKGGSSAYHNADFLIDVNNFSTQSHQLIYSVIKKLAADGVDQFDLPLIAQHCKNVNEVVFNRGNVYEILEELNQSNVRAENIEQYAKELARLGLYRELHERLEEAKYKLEGVNPSQSVLKTFGDIEKTIFDFENKLIANQQDFVDMGKKVVELLNFLAETKPKNQGIPTGFPVYDHCIGGGLRPGVHIIGARSGCGKTTLNTNQIVNVGLANIPMLYLDTEMSDKDILVKAVASLSGVSVTNIESGLFGDSMVLAKQVGEAQAKIQAFNFQYKNISGYAPQQTVSVIRNWIMKYVGFDANGNLNPCVVFLDYIKVMDIKDMGNVQEYQYLGQYITDLHNLTVKYPLPIVAMIQLNRDGIDREDAGAISGSDRITWLATSVTILKKKTVEDFVADPITNGSHKMVPIKSRYGPPLDQGVYINLATNFACAKIVENGTNVNTRGINIAGGNDTVAL